MFIKDLNNCEEFIAGDGSILRELLHPGKTGADLEIRYSLAIARIMPGQVTKLHKLKTSEVYYIVEGKGLMHIDKDCSEVYAGCAVYIPSRSKQYIENTGNSDLKFVCIVDPAWRKEDEEVFG